MGVKGPPGFSWCGGGDGSIVEARGVARFSRVMGFAFGFTRAMNKNKKVEKKVSRKGKTDVPLSLY